MTGLDVFREFVKVLWAFLPLFCGWFLGNWLAARAKSEVAKEWAGVILTVLSFLLLALHVLSVSTNTKAWNLPAAILLFELGVVIFVVSFTTLFLLEKFSPLRPSLYPHAKYLYSSFGGGNRALVLLGPISLLPMSKGEVIERQYLLDNFAVLDMGYFLPYMILLLVVKIYHFVDRRFLTNKSRCISANQSESQSSGSGGGLWLLFKRLLKEWYPFLLGLLVVSAAFGGAIVQGTSTGVGIHDTLSSWRNLMSWVLTLSATTYVFFKSVGVTKKIENYVAHATAFGITRMGCLFVAAWFVFDYTWSNPGQQVNALAMVCVMVMVFLPPSSFADKFAKAAGVDQTKCDEMSAVITISNWIFFVVVLSILLCLMCWRVFEIVNTLGRVS